MRFHLVDKRLSALLLVRCPHLPHLPNSSLYFRVLPAYQWRNPTWRCQCLLVIFQPGYTTWRSSDVQILMGIGVRGKSMHYRSRRRRCPKATVKNVDVRASGHSGTTMLGYNHDKAPNDEFLYTTNIKQTAGVHWKQKMTEDIPSRRETSESCQTRVRNLQSIGQRVEKSIYTKGAAQNERMTQ